MDFFGGEQWESDDESDEYFPNEQPPADIDKEFSKNLLNTKHTLYRYTVLSPNIDDEKSQDIELLENYLKHVNRLYQMTILVQNGKLSVRNMDEFPEEAKPFIHRTLDWLEAFFNKNHIPYTIPYTHYIRNQLHVFPLVQNNSFMTDE